MSINWNSKKIAQYALNTKFSEEVSLAILIISDESSTSLRSCLRNSGSAAVQTKAPQLMSHLHYFAATHTKQEHTIKLQDHCTANTQSSNRGTVQSQPSFQARRSITMCKNTPTSCKIIVLPTSDAATRGQYNHIHSLWSITMHWNKSTSCKTTILSTPSDKLNQDEWLVCFHLSKLVTSSIYPDGGNGRRWWHTSQPQQPPPLPVHQLKRHPD